MEHEFRLEAVLRHRAHLEQNAQRAFAQAHSKWLTARMTLDNLIQSCDQYRHELSEKLHNRFRPEEIILYNRYLARLKTEVARQQAQVDQLAKAKEVQRRQLMSAVKDRKMIEKLKSRHLETLEHQGREQEQKLLGEAAISRYQARAHRMDREEPIPDPAPGTR
jgi:flagellar FliJ protein